jgi:hypothetical protein
MRKDKEALAQRKSTVENKVTEEAVETEVIEEAVEIHDFSPLNKIKFHPVSHKLITYRNLYLYFFTFTHIFLLFFYFSRNLHNNQITNISPQHFEDLSSLNIL